MSAQDIIQLESFKLIEFHMEQPLLKDREIEGEPRFEIDYNIFVVGDNPPNRFMMVMEVEGVQPDKSPQPANGVPGVLGHRYRVAALAHFTVPADLDDAKKDRMLRLNGGQMLYGMLRGQFAVITGCFPAGSILLPTLNWLEIVKNVERRRQENERADNHSAEAAEAGGEHSAELPQVPVSTD